MNFEVDDIEGNQALDYNQLARQRDFGVDNGCGVSINTGTLGSGGNALTVAAGDVMFNGSSVSVTSQSVDIDTGGTNPRQDVVYLDSTGSAIVSTGTPEAVFPSDDDLTTFEYQRPAPNDLSETDAVVLCTVWVAAGATSISASDVRDRRVSSTASFTSVDTDQATIGSVNADEHTTGSVDITVSSASGTDLQTALNNYDVVRVAGRIEPATLPVTVPNDTTLTGWGRVSESSPFTLSGDVVAGTSSGAIVKVDSEGLVFGLGVRNDGGGYGIQFIDGPAEAARCDVYCATGSGIFGDQGHVEQKVGHCKVKSDDSSSGVGIELGATDAEIHHNIVNGWGDYQIKVTRANFTITNNHVYNFPHASGVVTGGVAANSKNGTITNNNIEPSSTEAGLKTFALDQRINHNRIWGLPSGTNAIQLWRKNSGDTVDDIRIRDNKLDINSGGAGEAIAGGFNVADGDITPTAVIADNMLAVDNDGLRQQNTGSASAADSGTIAHGLGGTPTRSQTRVWTGSTNRAYITAVDGTNLTIALEDPSGTAVATAETIYWSAEV